MRFEIDENLPVEIVVRLHRAGYDAMTVPEQDMVGEADQHLAEVCRREHRALVTLDLDFADIRTYVPEQYSGLLVLRVARQDKRHVMAVFERIIPLLERATLTKHLWVVDERSVRIRGTDGDAQTP
ncbi:MAG: DUF5615 family PIN-like protein [Phycisphaerae bacterium]|nr:DUF5615 family PIN-like protein [Phycisphaerae bacterium]